MHSYSVCFERMVSGFEEILATGERSCGFFLFTVKQNKSYHLFKEIAKVIAREDRKVCTKN